MVKAKGSSDGESLCLLLTNLPTFSPLPCRGEPSGDSLSILLGDSWHYKKQNMKTLEYYAKQTEGPGKFEGEKPLTVFLWEESMNGVGEVLSDPEVDGFHAEGFDLTSEEMETFQTEEREWVMIEDQQGFVFTIPLAKFEAYAGREEA